MKVTIAMPTLGSIDVRMASFLYSMVRRPGHEISIVHTARTDIVRARNLLIRDFLKSSSEALLFLDDDNPPDSPDFLEKLIAADKPVVTGLVPSRTPDEHGRYRLCIFGEHTTERGHEYVQKFTVPEGDEVFEVANCGMGCVLIKRGVVEAVAANYDLPCEARTCWYWKDENRWVMDDDADHSKIKDGTLRMKRYLSEDLIFFERARTLGATLWAHKGVTCWHIGNAEEITVAKHIIAKNACSR